MFLRRCYDERTEPVDIKVKIVFEFMVEFVAARVHDRFLTARFGIESCMEDGTVGFGRADRQVGFFFDQDRF